MNLGLLIIAHQLTPPLHCTINQCITNNITPILHVDAKSNLINFMPILDKVILTDKRINTQWGKYSQVETMLELLGKGIELKLDIMQFISGDSLPIRKIDEIKVFYQRHIGNSIFHYSELPKYQQRRLKYQYYGHRPETKFEVIVQRVRDRLNLYRKNPNYKLLGKLYWGSQWICLSYDAASYIKEFVNKNPAYIASFKYGLCVDAVFFHSILVNSQN